MHALDALLPADVGRRDELTLATSSSSAGRWLRSGDDQWAGPRDRVR